MAATCRLAGALPSSLRSRVTTVSTQKYDLSLAVLADPAYPEYLERIEWVGEGFYPEAFAIEEANARLAARFASSYASNQAPDTSRP